MNAAKIALLAGAAYLLWRAYTNSAAVSPAASPPTAGPTPPASPAPPPAGPAPTVQLTDNLGTTAYKVGDPWTLTVTGPPNSVAMISAWQNGTPVGTSSQLGTTDANGRLIVTGSWVPANAGAWVEQITVGGLAAPSLNFTVSPSGPGLAGPQFTVADLRSAVRRAVPVPILWVRGADGQVRPAVANRHARSW
jgi:hypothetical protein